MLIEGQLRVLIKGINQHSTVDAFSAHDPKIKRTLFFLVKDEPSSPN